MADKEPVLCYIEGDNAYFTTQALSKQWGDDWDDAPYEHNAGEPYEWDDRVDADKPKWEITKIKFDGDFEKPCDNHYNSPWSVQDINQKKVPWLGNHLVRIYAGTTLSEFRRLIYLGKGTIWVRWL